MRKKLFLFSLIIFFTIQCGNDTNNHKPVDFETVVPDSSNCRSNSGFLELVLDNKKMTDPFFEARFQHKGDFKYHTLQCYNAYAEGLKYPYFRINIETANDSLLDRPGSTIGIHFGLFIPVQKSPPYNITGEMNITQVTSSFIQGKIQGHFTHPVNNASFPFHADFKAVLKVVN